MLSDVASREPRAGLRPPATRRAAVLAAVVPTARVAHLGPAALTVALAAVPAIVTVARGDAVVSAPLIVTFLVAGAALGWATEDPARDLLSSLPVSSPMRATVRLGLVAAVAVIGIALTALVVAVGPGLPPDLPDRPAEAAGAAAVALAVGLVATRRGERGAGPVAVTGGILGPGLVAALAVRWPAVLPGFAAGPIHDRWWALAVVGAMVAARAGRDPGAANRRARRTRQSS